MMVWRGVAITLVALNLILLALRGLAPPVAVEQARDIPPLPEDVPGIDLVSELPAAVAPAGTDLCYTIGPLSSLLQQERAADRLRPFAKSVRVRRTEADRDRGWWVYLPPMTERQDALDMARRLAEAGVEDYYVVTSGDMENTLSLGLYEHQENARRRQARIRSLGFDAQMSVRREEAPQFWVDYRIAPDERSPWRFILRASPGAQHFEIPCFDQ